MIDQGDPIDRATATSWVGPAGAARWWRAVVTRANEPVDAASFAVFRIVFGAVLLFAMVRLVAYGWVDQLYIQPARHVPWEGLEWVRPLPGAWMYAHVGVIAGAAIGLILGAPTRPTAAVGLLGFVYLEAIDKVPYLNHYYLVTLVLGLLTVLPAEGAARWRSPAGGEVPRWVLWLLRFQLGVVYFFAGVTKLNADWLLRAQPLRLWLSARPDVPVVGPWLAEPATGFGMAWAGALFDLSVPFLLCLPATRLAAWVVLVVFHVLTGWLFPIGVFPWMMVGASLIFFPPDWPRRWVGGRAAPGRPPATPPLTRAGGIAVAAYALFQLVWPLRAAWMTEDLWWTEKGFRWSWRVLVVEKLGSLELIVRDLDGVRTARVRPEAYFEPWQAKMIATQPDMILQFAHLVRDEAAAEGREVAVYADAWVSFNGRPAARYVRADVDLARVEDGWGERWWLAPRPEGDAP